jgi:preprotein translocase subunit YajC
MRPSEGPAVDSPLVQDVTPLLFLVGIALLFWLLLVRPQARRQRELASMQSSLEVGDEVMLTSGLFGTVRALDDQVAHVEVADGVTIRVLRGAVGQVVPPEDDAHAPGTDGDHTTSPRDGVSEEN